MPRLKRRLTKERGNLDAQYDRLGEIKSILKTLSEEASIIQEEILDSPHKLDKAETPYGVLDLRAREKWLVVEKDDLIIEMGQDEYNKYSSITKTGIVKSVGAKGLKEYEDYGIVALDSVSEYYQLTVPK